MAKNKLIKVSATGMMGTLSIYYINMEKQAAKNLFMQHTTNTEATVEVIELEDGFRVYPDDRLNEIKAFPEQ